MDDTTGAGFYPLYLGLTFVLVLGRTLFSSVVVERSKPRTRICWALALFFIIFFAIRTHNSFFPDTFGYAYYYQAVRDGVISADDSSEYAFSFIRNICASYGLSVEGYFAVVAICYMVPIVLSCRQLFPGNEFLAMLGVVTSFAFYSGGGAIIRNGLAMSWMLWAISLWISSSSKKHRICAIAIAVCAYFFHHSIAITIAAFTASVFLIKSTRVSLLCWIAAIVITLIVGRHIGVFVAEWFGDERAVRYSMAGLDRANFAGFSSSGFRWDFLLYSAVGVAMIYYCTIKRNVTDKAYLILSNTYILTNAVWILFIYAKFSDRFARLSWFIMPFVLLYPVVKRRLWKNRNSVVSIELWGQWLFLLVMGWQSLLLFFLLI